MARRDLAWGEIPALGRERKWPTRLARAVILAALHELKAAGAKHAYVNPRGDAADPIPARLHRSLGFTDGPRTYSMVKSA